MPLAYKVEELLALRSSISESAVLFDKSIFTLTVCLFATSLHCHGNRPKSCPPCSHDPPEFDSPFATSYHPRTLP
jgi:hypothetical protein